MQTSGNNGGTWTNQTYTVDAHLHQYDNTTTFYYYACATNNTGNTSCSSVSSDLLQEAGQPPSVPHVYIPANTSYSGIINISYIQSISPNGYNISFYNITLSNPDESYNQTIVSNNSLNLNYSWNTIGVTDGNYLVKVVATDSLNQTSFDFSDPFIIDNTPPLAVALCNPSIVYTGASINCSCSGTDATSGVSSTTLSSSPSTLNSGTYTYTCTVVDNAGNSATSSATYSVNPTPSGIGSSPSGGSSSATTQSSLQTTLTPQNTPVLNFSNPSLGFDPMLSLDEMSITTNGEVSTNVIINKYSSAPSGIPSINSSRVYQYLQISFNNPQVLALLQNANLIFKVNKSWISENNISPAKISIYKLDNLTNNQWVALPTALNKTDSNFYYYQTNVNSFSYFAIGGQSVIVPYGNHQTNLSNNTLQIKGPFNQNNLVWWQVIIIAGVGIVLLVVVIKKFIPTRRISTKKRFVVKYNKRKVH